MSFITGNIKDILSIKLKCRHDAYTDQFSRIFMMKIFVISSLIMGVDYFNDKVTCIDTPQSGLSRDFVHSACWIQGFYIYSELELRPEVCGYFGIPKDVDMDGMYKDGRLCATVSKLTHLRDVHCKPMTKVFFLQFQYFPFYIASLAVLYYLPYMLFRVVNSDLTGLKTNINSKSGVCPQKIVENYFNYKMNGGKASLRVKVALNIAIKLIYVLVNFLSFWCTDTLLNSKYTTYGIEWVKWARLNNTLAFDYMGRRGFPKPGNFLLPAMGFCEITESSKDVRFTFVNRNKFICEISPNVLYQYVLIILWILFIVSIFISCCGVVLQVVSFIMIIVKRSSSCRKKFKSVYQDLTLREIEYMQFIRKKNLVIYGDVEKSLKKLRWNVEYNHHGMTDEVVTSGNNDPK